MSSDSTTLPSRGMRTVCMISDTHDAYDDRIYWKEACSLLHLGYTVIHICVAKESSTFISDQGIHIVQLNRNPYSSNRFLNLLIRFLPYINLHGRILRAAREQQADIYHLHDLSLLKIVRQLKRFPWKPKVIHCVRESYSDMIRDYAGPGWHTRLLKRIYAAYIEKWEIRKIRFADHIITIDDAAYEKFSKLAGNKVSLIYNFSNIFPDENSNYIKRYDLIYTGGITEQRGILVILEAIKKVKAKLPGIKLLLLGKIHNPTFRERIDQRITELDIKPNIEYKEFVPHPEVRRYLAESRIGLVTLLPIPKFHKNIPIKQFEYMAFGLPVVGSNLPPIENFIRPVEAGIIVDPENPVEIANAIEMLLTDHTLYKRMSENAVNAAITRYNWKSEEEKLARIYTNIT